VPSRTADPDARVLHVDLHPNNVMLGADGPVLIDWCNVGDGPPDLDVAMTALILAERVTADVPEAPMVRALIRAFLGAAGGDPVPHLYDAVPIRGSDVTLAAWDVDRYERWFRRTGLHTRDDLGARARPLTRPVGRVGAQDGPDSWPRAVPATRRREDGFGISARHTARVRTGPRIRARAGRSVAWW
jgi:Phosphotransferase enzyme family